jgi:hypothetical protein
MDDEVYRLRIARLEEENKELRKQNKLFRETLARIAAYPTPDPVKMLRRIALDMLRTTEKIRG